MKRNTANLIMILFSLAWFAWGKPVQAVDPDLIDVLEITGTDPIIVEDNILPGDTFSRTLSVHNLTGVSQDIALSLDVDTTKGVVWFPNFELEKQLFVQIRRADDSFVTLPGGGTTRSLQALDDTVIALGSVAGGATDVFTILVTFDRDAGNEYQRTEAYFNLSLGIDILGESPRLLLRKFNDSIAPEVPGSEVGYTLEVTAEGGAVDDVTVTDLPPEGFVYVAGSGAGAPFVHEYASPGIWNLGHMIAGETRTLTYRTKISGAQDAGLYQDLAFAKGLAGTTPLFANSAEDPFVGTEVAVVLAQGEQVVIPEDQDRDRKEKTKTKTQYVLGAATVLPLTGANIVIVVGALVAGVFGLGLIFSARRRSSSLLMLLFVLGGGTVLLSPVAAHAAALSVRIETPEAVVSSPNFQIGFVALDVLARPLTVECYREGDGTPFASYVLASAFGGNSGNCQVGSSVIPADGDYDFYVKAIASGEGAETVESNHVPVKVVAGPGTPLEYHRGENACESHITFVTAPDGGKTVKVELYRSSETTFTADTTTKVDEQLIGSDAPGSFIEALPGCDSDVFYALRAVDVFGNGSAFVGDHDINVDTYTVVRHKTKTVILPGATTGAIALNPAGQVQGAETEQGASGEAVAEEGTPSGSVLGEMTEAAGRIPMFFEEHPFRSLAIIVMLILFGYFGYRSYRKKHEQPLG